MKRIVSCFLLMALLFSLCACGEEAPPATTVPTEPAETLPPARRYPDATDFVVPNPIAYPDYTFDSEPTTDEMRAMVVRAFKDLLTFEWSTPTGIQYRKTGPISNKHFQHQPDVVYGGTIYSNASAGLFQFLEYYDFDTGRLYYLGDAEKMKNELGASCADAMIWGWTAVCNSITGPYYPSTMVQKNGYIPVGFYTYDAKIDSFYQLPTNKIVEQNGDDNILESYVEMQAGDALVSTPDDHGMMVISRPVVFREANGDIDTEASYVFIQDQRGGQGAGFYEVKENGYTVQLSGRAKAKFTFKELLEKAYIPVAPAELLGEKPYEKAEVTATGGPFNTVEDLLKGEVSANYPLAVVNVLVADKAGSKHVLERKCFGGAEDNGVPRSYKLDQFECLKNFQENKYNVATYLIRIEVVVSTGERFVPIEIEI